MTPSGNYCYFIRNKNLLIRPQAKLNYLFWRSFTKLQSCPHNSWKLHVVSLCLWCPGWKKKNQKNTSPAWRLCAVWSPGEDSLILTQLWLKGEVYHSGERRQSLVSQGRVFRQSVFLGVWRKTTLSSLRESQKLLCIELQESKLVFWMLKF